MQHAYRIPFISAVDPGLQANQQAFAKEISDSSEIISNKVQ